MQRTDYSSEIDGALINRNGGSQGYQEVARSGNGNMRTDLLADDCRDYEEIEGLGETTEEMSAAESAAEDAGDSLQFTPFREPYPGEVPPYPPKPGMAWLRRCIRVNARKPGGRRLVRARWVQVSPKRYQELLEAGKVRTASGVGFFDISSSTIRNVAIGAGIGVLAMIYMGGRRKPTIIK